MKFNQLLPSALAISFTSAIYVLVAQYFQISAIWLPFISWSSYFIAGGKPSLLPKIAIGFMGGMFIGCFTVLAASPLSNIIGPAFALPVVVFFMVLIILLMELIKSVDMVPIYFFSYSSYFAYFFGGFGGEKATEISIMPMFFLLLMIGMGLGYFTFEMRKKIMRIQGL